MSYFSFVKSLQLSDQEIFSVQNNSVHQCFKVTFLTEDIFHRVFDLVRGAGNGPVLKSFSVHSMWEDLRTVMVMMFNPFVDDETIAEKMNFDMCERINCTLHIFNFFIIHISNHISNNDWDFICNCKF